MDLFPPYGDSIRVTSPSHVSAETEPLIDRLRRATIGRYDIYAELGSGGMASVFLALDLALDRKVAIKVLAPNLASAADNVTRFRREAKVAAALDHPNIIGILAVGEDPALAFFVMKYVEGSTLDSVIASEGAQSVAFARSVLATTARALHYAHQRGVIHRDVKPANLMLDLEGRLIITDFGIAKMEDAQGLTITGSVIGTPYYMSPEQFNGLPVSGATDQYALGVVAYELLTGLQPYRGRTVGEVMRGHLFDPIPSVRSEQPEVPEALDAAVTRMLAKSAEDRFATLEDAARAIESGGGLDESLVRTHIIELARSGARLRPEMHVPVSPSPAVRARVAPAAAAAAATTVITQPPRRRVLAALVTVAIVVGAVGATAALRPDLLGLGGGSESAADSATLSPQILTEPAPDTGTQNVAAAPDSTPVQSTPAASAPVEAPRVAPTPSPTRRNGGRVLDVMSARREQRASERAASNSPPPQETVTPPPAPVVVADTPRTAAPVLEPEPEPVTSRSVIIGSNVPLSVLRVNGGPAIPARRIREHQLPLGRVHLTVTAPGCVPFDTTIIVVAGPPIRIGNRPTDCRSSIP